MDSSRSVARWTGSWPRLYDARDLDARLSRGERWAVLALAAAVAAVAAIFIVDGFGGVGTLPVRRKSYESSVHLLLHAAIC